MAVNAPEAGTVKEFLAQEEDTVTVGQDLVKMELGGSTQSEKEEYGGQEPKAAATKDQATSSDPSPAEGKTSDDHATSSDQTLAMNKADSKPEMLSTPTRQEDKQSRKPESLQKQAQPPARPTEPQKTETTQSNSDVAFSKRDERRA